MVGVDAENIAEIKDSLCMLAVKNSVAENQSKFKEESANYNFHPKNNEFLQSVSGRGFAPQSILNTIETHKSITDPASNKQNDRQG